MAKKALGYLGRRPLKLVRHVHGTTFYHKGPLPEISPAVHRLTVQKREGGEGTRLWVDDLEGLLGLVEIGAVELHPWNSTVDDFEHADVLVFELGPGEAVEWAFVRETAFQLRDLLKTGGHDSRPKQQAPKVIPFWKLAKACPIRSASERFAHRGIGLVSDLVPNAPGQGGKGRNNPG